MTAVPPKGWTMRTPRKRRGEKRIEMMNNEMMQMMNMMSQMMNTMNNMMSQMMTQSATQPVSVEFSNQQKEVAKIINELPEDLLEEPVETVTKTATGHSIYHSSDIKCKWTIEKINNKCYILKDGIFTFGRWFTSKTNANEEIRGRINLEAHAIALMSLKNIDNIKAFDITTNDGTTYKGYGFTTKKACEEAINHLPEAIQAVQIEDYIKKNGKIKFKWAVRDAHTKQRIR